MNKKTWSISSWQDLKTGIHLGHKSIRLSKSNFWHPLMANYFLGIKDGIGVFNTQQTRKCILRAFFLIALILKKKGHILIVNTNPEFFRICKNFIFCTTRLQENSLSKTKKENHQFRNLVTSSKNYSTKLSYSSYKWVGGTLTNWKQVSKSILTFAKFSERCEKFLIQNNIDFPRYNKIKKSFQGLVTSKGFLAFHEKPDLVFIMNPNENKNIIAEANRLDIPVIAFVESNTNLNGISYPIPTNNYSINFVYYSMKKLVKIEISS